jgi:biotin transport system substrate-specific component
VQGTAIIDNYQKARYLFFKWRYNLAIIKKLVLAFGMACITGLLAQIYIPLPFTPVPMTGQVLGVLLSGIVCGGVFGSISQIIYVGLGIAGVPWFAGGTAASLVAFIHPTGGYLIGFIIAPLVIGRYSDRYIGARTFLSQLIVMMVGVGIIYLFGAIVLAFVIKASFWETMIKGVIPFILVDLIKAVIAASFSSSILPKSSYDGEMDRSKYLDRTY